MIVFLTSFSKAAVLIDVWRCWCCVFDWTFWNFEWPLPLRKQNSKTFRCGLKEVILGQNTWLLFHSIRTVLRLYCPWLHVYFIIPEAISLKSYTRYFQYFTSWNLCEIAFSNWSSRGGAFQAISPYTGQAPTLVVTVEMLLSFKVIFWHGETSTDKKTNETQVSLR